MQLERPQLEALIVFVKEYAEYIAVQHVTGSGHLWQHAKKAEDEFCARFGHYPMNSKPAIPSDDDRLIANLHKEASNIVWQYERNHKEIDPVHFFNLLQAVNEMTISAINSTNETLKKNQEQDGIRKP